VHAGRSPRGGVAETLAAGYVSGAVSAKHPDYQLSMNTRSDLSADPPDQRAYIFFRFLQQAANIAPVRFSQIIEADHNGLGACSNGYPFKRIRAVGLDFVPLQQHNEKNCIFSMCECMFQWCDYRTG
jgi:hypothetical protein